MEFVIIILFAVFSIWIIWLGFRQQKKAHKVLLDKNYTLEETGVTVSHIGEIETAIFYECKLCYAENHLLILQKFLFGRGFRIRCNIFVCREPNHPDHKKSHKQNFLEFYVSPGDISIVGKDGRFIYTIKLPSRPYAKNESLEFESIHKLF